MLHFVESEIFKSFFYGGPRCPNTSGLYQGKCSGLERPAEFLQDGVGGTSWGERGRQRCGQHNGIMEGGKKVGLGRSERKGTSDILPMKTPGTEMRLNR